MPHLPVKTGERKVLSSGLSVSFATGSPVPFSSRHTFSPVFLLLLLYCTCRGLLVPFISYQNQLWAGFPSIVSAYSGSICIFLGHPPLLSLLYASLLCLDLVRSFFLLFTYLLLPFAFIPVCRDGWLLSLEKIILENQLAFLEPSSF